MSSGLKASLSLSLSLSFFLLCCSSCLREGVWSVMVKLLHLVCGIVPAKQCTASGHMVKHFQWALGKVGESTGSSKSCIMSIYTKECTTCAVATKLCYTILVEAWPTESQATTASTSRLAPSRGELLSIPTWIPCKGCG